MQLVTDNCSLVTHLLKDTISTGIVPQKGLRSREYIGVCKGKYALRDCERRIKYFYNVGAVLHALFGM